MSDSLALVDSGEYLPAMAAFEKYLIDDGVKNDLKSKSSKIIGTKAPYGSDHAGVVVTISK